MNNLLTCLLDLVLLDRIIRERALVVNEGRDAVHRHATHIDAPDHSVAQDRIKEVAIVTATRMGIDTIVEIIEETTDVAAGQCHFLLHALALSCLNRTMGRPGRRRGTTVGI